MPIKQSFLCPDATAEERTNFVFLFWRYRVLFNALMVAILSMPAVGSMPLMSPRLFPALLHSASRMSCLISCAAGNYDNIKVLFLWYTKGSFNIQFLLCDSGKTSCDLPRINDFTHIAEDSLRHQRRPLALL